MTANELKLCPFCGENVEMHDYTTKPAAAWVMIHRCKVIGPIKLEAYSGNALRLAWNTRAATTLADAMAVPEVQALVEAARNVKREMNTQANGGTGWMFDVETALAPFTKGPTE